MKTSVLLLTFNEERNLPRCLAALAWCDDVVAVDSGSTDATRALLRRAGVRVLSRPFDTFARQRNYGLDHGGFRHDWVLHLDADEVVPPAFRARLAALEPPDGIDAYRVPSRLMLDGRWLRRAGMYPAYQVRLGRRDRLRFVEVGHGQREAVPAERMATFDEPYLHHNFSHGPAAWLAKHLRYAEAEAALLSRPGTTRASLRDLFARDGTRRRRAMKRLAGRMPPLLRPFARFVYVYLLRRGFLDGRAGLRYAFMLATYEAMIAVLATGRADPAAAPREPDEVRSVAGEGGAAEPTIAPGTGTVRPIALPTVRRDPRPPSVSRP